MHRKTLLLLLFTLCASLGRAQMSGDDGLAALHARAEALRGEADALKTAAEKEFIAADLACWKKFLVNRCKDAAALDKQDKLAAARALKQQAIDIERDIRRREYAQHIEEREAAAPQRAADAAAQAEENRQAQQAAQERVERRRAENPQRTP